MTIKNQELDALFAEAQAQPRLPSDTLLEHVLRDADAVQSQTVMSARPGPVTSINFWGIVGGWAGAVSFATCIAAGIYLGYLAPDLMGVGSGANTLSFHDAVLGELTVLYEEI
ncbi:MAG: hypothetical protein AAF198_13500 [Pseudomonadota bacterium]